MNCRELRRGWMRTGPNASSQLRDKSEVASEGTREFKKTGS